MLFPFPRCRRRVLPSSCPGAVDGGVGDGFRAVGAREGLAVDASRGTAVVSVEEQRLPLGQGVERRKLFSLLSLSR